ncbi:hypothetical protein JL721_1905 [Aureococcus anophagefferens]|nr:hypothetical protein JL721_1905 [Aureococcus anophagefferens]
MEGRSRDEQWLLDVVTRCGISAARASDVALQGAQMLRRLNIKVPVGLFKKGECCRRAVALELASREAGGASLRRDALVTACSASSRQYEAVLRHAENALGLVGPAERPATVEALARGLFGEKQNTAALAADARRFFRSWRRPTTPRRSRPPEAVLARAARDEDAALRAETDDEEAPEAPAPAAVEEEVLDYVEVARAALAAEAARTGGPPPPPLVPIADVEAFYRISPADIRALEAFEAATAPPEPEVKPLLVLRDYPDLPKANQPAANDDDEDAPAPKKRGPKKKKADEEDAPKKRGPKKQAANEEEDAAPKKRGPKKKAANEEEDAAPKKRGPKKKAERDDDAPAKKKRGAQAPAEDEAPPAKKRGPPKKREDAAPKPKKKAAKKAAVEEEPLPPVSSDDDAAAPPAPQKRQRRSSGARARRPATRRGGGRRPAVEPPAQDKARVAFTCTDDDPVLESQARRAQQLSSAGLLVADSAADATVVVVGPRLQVKTSVAIAFARGVPIVTSDWLAHCASHGYEEPSAEFASKDAAFSRRYSVNLLDDGGRESLLRKYAVLVKPGYVLTDKPRYKVAAECAGAVWIAAAPRKPEGRALLIIDAACSFNDAHLHVQPKDFLLAILRNEDPAGARHPSDEAVSRRARGLPGEARDRALAPSSRPATTLSASEAATGVARPRRTSATERQSSWRRGAALSRRDTAGWRSKTVIRAP